MSPGDQRSACESELKTQTVRKRNRYHTQENAQHYSQRERKVIGFRNRLQRIAKIFGCAVHIVALGDYTDAIPHFKHHIRSGDHVDVAAPHSGDNGMQFLGNVQVANRLPDNRFV